MNQERYEVLVVGDDPRALSLAVGGLKERDAGPVHLVRSGAEALRYLRRDGEHFEATIPDLVLMDVQLPDVPGHEVFAEVRADPGLCSVPVVLMTASRADSDILMTCGAGGRCYVSRPETAEQFSRMLDVIERFWFGVVRVPPRCLQ
ncbi:MAG: response regulator [Elusimicrobia bacterium]|nr:response regulator [Elusimicrobiota bacterium]